jgi:hypothetical protein
MQWKYYRATPPSGQKTFDPPQATMTNSEQLSYEVIIMAISKNQLINELWLGLRRRIGPHFAHKTCIFVALLGFIVTATRPPGPQFVFGGQLTLVAIE